MRGTRVLKMVFMVLIVSAFSGSVLAQQTPDKVVMINGEEKIGQVTEMGDTYVKFVHTGETLVYTLQKKEINKIQFGSGRIEFVTAESSIPASGGNAAPSLQDHHNVVVILPFTYIGSGGSRDDKMGIKSQSDCYDILRKSASQLTVSDPVTTNAMLIKNGVNESNVGGYTPSDLANMLGAEYVIYCTIEVSPASSSTTQGNVFGAKDKGKKTTGYSVGTSTTSTNFATTVNMKIYNDQGRTFSHRIIRLSGKQKTPI